MFSVSKSSFRYYLPKPEIMKEIVATKPPEISHRTIPIKIQK